MRLVGITSQVEGKVATRERPFRVNEYLVVEGNPGGVLVEVVGTYAVNPLLPEAAHAAHPGLIDEATLGTLQALGYDPAHETFYLAEVRVVEELSHPLEVGAKVRPATFEEVRPHLLPEDWQKAGALLGVVRGTEEFELPEELKELVFRYLPGEDRAELMPGVPFFLPWSKFSQYPHVGIFGGSGSGKSFALRVLLEELMYQEIPTLVFDPHFELSFDEPLVFAEPFLSRQKELASRALVFQLGQDADVRFEDLDRGELVTLLKAAMEGWTEQMDHAASVLWQVGDSLETYRTRLNYLIEGLTFSRRFEQDLKKLEEGKDPAEERFPDDPLRQAEYRDKLKVYQDFRDAGIGESTAQAVQRRLNYLHRIGLFGSRGTAGIEEALQQGKVCIVRGESRKLILFAAYALRRLFRRRRDYRDGKQYGVKAFPYFPPFFVVTDEAHVLVPKVTGERDFAPARSIIREIAQEGRKYGVFLILATQRPSLLDDTVNAQLNTKLILRTVRAQDLDVIKRETDLGPGEIARLPYLSSGNAFVSSAIVQRTVPITVRASWTRSPHAEDPFTEWREYRQKQGEDLWPVVREFIERRGGYIREMDLTQCLQECERRLHRRVSEAELRQALKRWSETGKLKATTSLAFGGYRWTLA
ncbi:ATP-binding protein [Ammonifex thiophilus]|uniref:ATP-binding protein n=1 Tax=Ammonifex thiophilus TaxID=444093 RepID=A0A3D8P397_9THEO|nr:ATP-binding protein [Ammonifex thiophilus]RDV83248.1 ATP-binding protein [Ammonifex thiophilus]